MSAAAVAVATPCWPAPVSATSRRLAHAASQQRLAQHVVDLVRAGVVQVLALEQQPTAQLLAEAVALRERAGPTGVVAPAARRARHGTSGSAHASRNARSSSWSAGTRVSGTKLPPNSPNAAVLSRGPHRGGHGLQGTAVAAGPPKRVAVPERSDPRLGPVERAAAGASAPDSVAAARGRGHARGVDERLHLQRVLAAGLAVDLDTGGHVDAPRVAPRRCRSATLSGVRPPARISRRLVGAPSARDQSKT